MAVRRRETPRAAGAIQDRGAAAQAVLLAPQTDGQGDAHGGSGADHGADAVWMTPALLTALYMHLPSGLIAVDTTGRVVFINEAGKRLSAEVVLASERVAGGLSQPAIASSLVPYGARIASVLAGHAVPDVDYVLGLQEGEILPRVVQVAFMTLRDSREGITGAVLTLTDQTERVGGQAKLARVADTLAEGAREALARTAITLAEEAVTQAQDNRELIRSSAEGEERFRLLVGSVRDCALFMLDLQGKVISWNEGAQRIKGYTAAQIMGQHISVFYTPEDRARGLPEQDLRHVAAEGYYAAEGWRVRQDGTFFWAEVQMTAIYDADAYLIGFGKVTRDLTEPRRVAEEISQLNASLEARVAARTADLAAANTQLTALNQELEAFAYSVSHDLRTPLRAISGFGEILLTSYGEVLDTRGRHYLERIRNGTTQMGQLIDDLLALSRLTRAQMHSGPVDLTRLARAMAVALKETAPERAVTWDIAEGLIAHGDAALLRVVLDNLLGNAWKFTSGHAEAHIEVGMRQDEGETVYFVRDDGAGFDMAYAAKLFGAFQRLHTVREFAGTGIGLATVQRIIHRHGGHIWAQGVVEQGTTLAFTLAAPGGGQHGAGG